jgi:hypothetical protein
MPRRHKAQLTTATEPDKWIGTVIACRMLGGIHRTTLLRYAIQGALESQHIGGRTLLSRESVERLARELERKTA